MLTATAYGTSVIAMFILDFEEMWLCRNSHITIFDLYTTHIQARYTTAVVCGRGIQSSDCRVCSTSMVVRDSRHQGSVSARRASYTRATPSSSHYQPCKDSYVRVFQQQIYKILSVITYRYIIMNWFSEGILVSLIRIRLVITFRVNLCVKIVIPILRHFPSNWRTCNFVRCNIFSSVIDACRWVSCVHY